MGEFDWVPVQGCEGPALFRARLVSDYHGDLGVVPIYSVSDKGVEFDDGGRLHLPWSCVTSLQAISGAQPRCWLCDAPIGVGFQFCSECWDGDVSDGVWPADGEAGVLRARVAELESQVAALQARVGVDLPAPAPALSCPSCGCAMPESARRGEVCSSCFASVPAHFCPECLAVRVVDPSEPCDSCAGGPGPGAPAPEPEPVPQAAAPRRSWRSRSRSRSWLRVTLSWRVDGPAGVRRVAR